MDDDGSRVRGMMEASSLPDVWLSHYGSVCLSFLAASQHEKSEVQTNSELLVQKLSLYGNLESSVL